MLKLIKNSFLVLIVMLAIMNPMKAFAEDEDVCETYSLQEMQEGALGDQIMFNSIVISDMDNDWYKDIAGSDIPNGFIEDERNFVGARKYIGINDGQYNRWEGDSITAEDGKTYIIRIFAHNDNPNGMDAVAEDTKVRFYVPDGSATSQVVKGHLTSSNAIPTDYSDTVVFRSENGIPFSLQYIYGSALLENGGFASGDGVQLPDSITNQGNPTNMLENEWTLIGYDALDGKVPGGYAYSNYVSIMVKVVYDYKFNVETKVRLADSEDKTWQDTIEAQIGDKVEFQIQYDNTSDYIQSDVMIGNFLPSNLRYVEGTAKIYNTLYPDGALLAEGISDTTASVRAGNYAADSNAIMRFTAEVVNGDLALGENALYSWGQVAVGSKVIQDHATVIVYNVGATFYIVILVLCVLILVCLVIIVVCCKKIWQFKKRQQ